MHEECIEMWKKFNSLENIKLYGTYAMVIMIWNFIGRWTKIEDKRNLK